jgi:HAMP domain-containing protein
MQGVRMGVDYVALETGEDGELVVRVLVNDPRGRRMMLQAIFPTSARIERTRLAAGERLQPLHRAVVPAALAEVQLLADAVAGAGVRPDGGAAGRLRTAQRLVAPVADIARGTRAVADGDYEQRLPLPAQDDELAFLVASFNAMTRRIAQARDQAARSQRAVEEQRSLSADRARAALQRRHRLRPAAEPGTMNPAARQILRCPSTGGAALAGRAGAGPSAPLHWGETVRRHIAAGGEWREEVTLFGNRRPPGADVPRQPAARTRRGAGTSSCSTTSRP